MIPKISAASAARDFGLPAYEALMRQWAAEHPASVKMPGAEPAEVAPPAEVAASPGGASPLLDGAFEEEQKVAVKVATEEGLGAQPKEEP